MVYLTADVEHRRKADLKEDREEADLKPLLEMDWEDMEQELIGKYYMNSVNTSGARRLGLNEDHGDGKPVEDEETKSYSDDTIVIMGPKRRKL